jgi:UDP-glucose 4-epimerase
MKNIRGSEILITGGAGFIGSTLAHRLVAEGASVTILDAFIKPYGANKFNLNGVESKVKLIKGDIRSDKLINKTVSGKDYVFHLAGQTGRTISMENPSLDADINCIGTLTIINSILKQKRMPKLIFASSRGVIGRPVYLPVDEKHPENPRDAYGISKLAAEKYCLLFGKEYGFESTALRLNNVYGPRCQIRSNHYGTVNLFIAYALQGKAMPIYGTGKQTRDYVYIDDVVEAFIKSMSSSANGEYFFVGTGKATSLLSIVKEIEQQINHSKHRLVPFPEMLRSVDFPEFYSSSQKIQKKLSWRPKTSIEEGIKRTVDFYRINLKYYT